MKNHMKLVQNECNTQYGCSENGCERVYSSTNSLRKHHKMNHTKITSEQVTQKVYEPEALHIVNNTVELNSNPMHSTNDVGIVAAYSINDGQNDKTNITKTFAEVALQIVISLYADANSSRKQAEYIINKIEEVVNNECFESIKEIIDQNVVDALAKQELKKKWEEIQTSFSNIYTQWKFISALKKSNYFVNSKKVVFGYREECVKTRLIYKSDDGSIISLKCVLSKFFEIPNIYEKTKNYISQLQSDNTNNISNIIQTDY